MNNDKSNDKKTFTPGPWTDDEMVGPASNDNRHEVRIRSPFAGRIAISTNADPITARTNARLIAAAPAMSLALDLIAYCGARIEDGEFCFAGLRYSMNGDWNGLISVIGWDYARAAIAKALGQ